ncbi:MAG: hypothetical protein VYE04_09780 [Pseudomonadota bacterium]|nr:hypothetical protein [Pseudomonadota bacterium]
MNWEALGAIAELFGAIAVLLTLVYLTIQIRQNANAIIQQNKVATAQIMQNRGDTLINFFAMGLNDEKALAIFSSLFQRSDLDSTREFLVVNTARAVWENMFHQNKAGFLPEEYYKEGVVTALKLAGPKFLESDTPMSEDFRAEIVRLLQEQEENFSSKAG